MLDNRVRTAYYSSEFALDGIRTWRGCSARKGTPEEMIAWFPDRCGRISSDPDWIRFMEDRLIALRSYRMETFTRILRQAMETAAGIPNEAERIGGTDEREGEPWQELILT